MDVSSKNYLDILPEILEKLEIASFVSFDAEYTGLKGDDGEGTSLFDTTSLRYEVLRRVVYNNSAPQFGISMFQRMCGPEYTMKQVYKIDSYCFYLSEACFANFNMNSIKASIDIDCCQFLNGIGFDFEKWFKYPVPYLNENKVKELEDYLSQNPVLPNGYHLDKYIFPECMKNKRLTEEDTKEIIRKLRGFSAIVDVISRRKIPVVGHNMILDLMYFFRQFCRDLPEKYEDFKIQVATFLPVIYDTKYMTVRCRKNLDHPTLNHSQKDIKQLMCSGLYMVYKSSSKVVDKFSPNFILAETCKIFSEALEIGKAKELEEEENSPLCHTPSFDACVTGIVFLNLSHIACRISKTMFSKEEAPTFEEVIQYARHWQDQIFVARATVNTMCLKGDDPRPSRSWVRVVSKNKEKINGSDIISLLNADSTMQPQLRGVDYQEISDTQVILAVSRAKCAYEICDKLQNTGLEATKILIPWDKKRYETINEFEPDFIYDTGRNKLFS